MQYSFGDRFEAEASNETEKLVKFKAKLKFQQKKDQVEAEKLARISKSN